MMLRIKRVPTVVSNYQKEETEEAAAAARRVSGCGRNCLNKCCIQGACLKCLYEILFIVFGFFFFSKFLTCFGSNFIWVFV